MKLRNQRTASERLKSPEDSDTSSGERARWIVDPTTDQPLPPRAQPGYYPGFSTLAQQAFWDEATRRVVLNRVESIPPMRFFSPEEARLMEAVCARLLPQDDRDAAHRIPIVPRIDERLHAGHIDGYRYVDMPPDGEAYHLGLRGIQAVAQAMFGKRFEQLGPLDQDQALKTIHDDAPPGADEIWQQLPPRRFWVLIVQDVIEAYYSHPWAWDEIGFGGPAYPRGYMRLDGGKPEPWEKQGRRYEWVPPHESLSGEDTPLGGPGGHKSQPSGQEGTH